MKRLLCAFWASRSAIAVSIVIGHAPLCYALLIDDFSVNQQGILTGQNAAYDYTQAEEIFGGTRVIWGGASEPCNSCFTTTVTGGQLRIIAGTGVSGAGDVSWTAAGNADPVATFALSADLSSLVGLEVDILELTGPVLTRFSIASGRDSGGVGWDRLDVYFNSPGRHTVSFSSFHHNEGPLPLNLHDVNSITMATAVDAGNFVVFDSVSAVVPEPDTLSLVASIAVCAFVRSRRKSADMNTRSTPRNDADVQSRSTATNRS